MKKAIFTLAAIAALAAAPAFAQSKVASADIETIVRSHPNTKTNTEELLKLKDEMEGKLSVKHEAAKTARDDVEKAFAAANNPTLSDTQRKTQEDMARALAGVFRQKEAEFFEERDKLQDQLRDKEIELLDATLTDITNAIKKIAAAEKYDYVLDNSAIRVVLYANPANDITDKVIAEVKGKRVDKNAKTEEK